MEWLLENFEWMVLLAGLGVIVGVFVLRHLRLEKERRDRP